jgi:cell division protein FtsL
MATQAAWYEMTETDSSAPQGQSLEEQYCLRPLPNEDICLWETPVDNSRVVRHTDPALWSACWRFITMAALGVIVVVGLLLPNAYGMLAGYRLHKLEQEQQQLLAERRMLEMEYSRLVRTERLEELAERWEFVAPPPENVHYLRPSGDESVAYITGKR